ncbi:MAG: restriction endonuclease subunit S [Spirochaetaceae bacterium]|nr:restriction endonuclease subunit S [Spirochaetaceae bacterium]
MNTDVVKLGEITSITKLAGFEFTKYFNYNQTGEIIALRALNLRNGKLDLTDIHRIDKSISDKLPRSKLYKGDILFTYTGNGYGDCALVDEDDKYHLAPNICKITSNQEKVDYTFLFYTIRSKSFYGQVSGFIGGSGQPTIPMERIRKLKIFLPKMQVQQKIANILSRYDEAIENNNKRIKLLEQMAQNLYKEWFVRFRFPGWENCEFENGIPKGWHQGRLSELLEFKRGKNITADEMEDGDVSVISAGLEPSGYHSTSNVQGVSLTISSSGANAGYLAIHYEDIWAADCMFITEKNTKNIYYLYELLNNIRPVIFNQQRGAAQPHVYSKDINNLRLWIPNEELIENANKLFESFHKEIYQLQRANKNLAKQRDLLLPRLMSGKLEV